MSLGVPSAGGGVRVRGSVIMDSKQDTRTVGVGSTFFFWWG